MPLPNAAAGTVTGSLVKKVDTAGVLQVTKTAVTDINNAFGAVKSGAGTSGTAQVSVLGAASVLFDNVAVTDGDFLIVSTSVAGTVSDAGTTFPTGALNLGVANGTHAACGSPPCGPWNVILMTPDALGAAGTGIVANPAVAQTIQPSTDVTGLIEKQSNTTNTAAIKRIENKSGTDVFAINSLGNITAANWLPPETSAVQRSIPATLSQWISVEDFGAIADGTTNNATAINAAISYVASLGWGHTLLFPCTNSVGIYNVTSAISFAALQHTRLLGSGISCQLSYVGGSASNYAFSFVGADTITVENLTFFSQNTTVPKTVVLLGRLAGNAASAHDNFLNVSVEGYASTALVYSIGSEEDYWIGNYFILNGGGALYVWYTSVLDDLAVGTVSANANSNLSVYMEDFHILDFSAVSTTHTAITDAIAANAAGDHVYMNGYMATGGTGFEFRNVLAGSGIISSARVTVENIRLESATRFCYFNSIAGTTYVVLEDFRINGNTLDSSAGVSFYANSGGILAMWDLVSRNNVVINGETSALPQLSVSVLDDTFTSTIGTGSTFNSISQRASGGITYDGTVVAGAFQGNGAAPTTTGSTCGTIGTQTGNNTNGTIQTATVTACTLKLNFATTAPNGWNCWFSDRTSVPASLTTQMRQASSNTTSCTSNAATITAGNLMQFSAFPY
jgi:hypothetical protein